MVRSVAPALIFLTHRVNRATVALTDVACVLLWTKCTNFTVLSPVGHCRVTRSNGPDVWCCRLRSKQAKITWKHSAGLSSCCRIHIA